MNKNTDFNLFRAMFNWHNEKFLHSSFIAMLLSMRKEYLKCFLERMFHNITMKDSLQGQSCKALIDIFLTGDYRIYPNEAEHREIHQIDISIWSPNGEYVIIIENKLFAKDRHSQHITQLGRYGEAILKDKELNINSSEHIFYVYLTLRGLEPTVCPGQSEHKLSHLALMSYEKDIKDWVLECMESEKDAFKKEIMRQYWEVLNTHVNDSTQVINLMKHFTENEDEMKTYFEVHSHGDDMMRHLKWHTMHSLICGLLEKLEEEGFVICDEYVNPDKKNKYATRRLHEQVTSMVDRKKVRLIINFTYQERNYYLCYDAKGFTVGVIPPASYVKLAPSIHWNQFEESYEVFCLVNEERRQNVILEYAEEIKSFVKEKGNGVNTVG